MKVAKYFYHYRLFNNNMQLVGNGSGVTDIDLTVMDTVNEDNSGYKQLIAVIRAGIGNRSNYAYIDIDMISKL